MTALIIILYLITCVISGAMADGLNEKGKKDWGHPLEALSILLLLSGAFIFELNWTYIVAYTCFRIAFFDYAKNLTKGDPLFYLGTSNVWDRFFRQFPSHGVTFMRIIFLAVAISIPFKYL